MDKSYCLFLLGLVITYIFSFVEAIDNEDDSQWLESILAAPRARLGKKHQYIYSDDIHKRLKLLEDFIFSNDDFNNLLRRFAETLDKSNGLPSYRKRSWIDEDYGNRATETTPTFLTTLSTIPSSNTPTTTAATTTTTSGRANNNPQIPSFPGGWIPPWSLPSWPFNGWGKRRRRALVSNRKF